MWYVPAIQLVSQLNQHVVLQIVRYIIIFSNHHVSFGVILFSSRTYFVFYRKCLGLVKYDEGLQQVLLFCPPGQWALEHISYTDQVGSKWTVAHDSVKYLILFG